MYAFNTSNSSRSKYDIRAILESIALQAAESFEACDDNSSVPDAFASELDQCSKAISKLHSLLTQGNNNFPMTGSVPVPNEPPTQTRTETKTPTQTRTETPTNTPTKTPKTLTPTPSQTITQTKTPT